MDGVTVGKPGFLIGGGEDQTTCNDVIKQFGNKKLSTRQRYHTMEDQKPWPGLARNQDFAEGRGIDVNVEKRKCLNLETG